MRLIPVQTSLQRERLARLAEAIWREHYTPILGPEQVAYMVANYQSYEAIGERISQGERYWLMLEVDKPVGYCAFSLEEDALFLSKLYVAAPYRGRGLAAQALRELERVAREAGLKRIYLHVNRGNGASIAAYRALGFAVEREIDTDIGQGFAMNDYIMAKRV